MPWVKEAVLLWTAACAGARGETRSETRGETIDDGVRWGAAAQPVGEVRPEDDAALAAAPRLELILRLARARSPELAEARQRAVARAARAEVEEALPPPRLKYEQWHVPLAEPYALDRADMLMVGVEQELPAPGSRGARADAVRAEAREGAAEARARDLELVRQVKRAFVDYQEVRREIDLHQEHLALSRGLVDATRAMYAAGRGNQQEVLVAELQATRLHAHIVALEQHERSVRALLNSLMVRAIDAPLGVPPPLAAPARETPPVASLTRLQEAHRPELEAAALRRARAAATKRAADRERLWPSFMLGADYMLAPEDAEHRHGYGLMLSMTLPWLTARGRAGARAAAEDALAEARGADATRVALRYELEGAAAHVDAARRTLETIERELLPEAERAWKAARTVFGAGQGNTVAVLGSLDTYLQIRLEQLRAQAELQRTVADLERAVGVDLGGAP